jgi:hypothetical protein
MALLVLTGDAKGDCVGCDGNLAKKSKNSLEPGFCVFEDGDVVLLTVELSGMAELSVAIPL